MNKTTPAFFRFAKNKGGYLITNDLGRFAQLSGREFSDFVGGKVDKKSDLYTQLAGDFFIKDDSRLSDEAATYRHRYRYLLEGPTLHIVVVTLRCNYKCVYCQANRRDTGTAGYDMTRATARNVVDRIFESPGKNITIEFQGGEPLLNWPVVKFIIEYAQKKDKERAKNLKLTMVTNLSLMTGKIYDFLLANNVSLCTSLDGPREVHNRNRPWPRGDSYKATTGWIRKMRAEEAKRGATKNKGNVHKISALVTITKRSLQDLTALVDEYRTYGFRQIHLRRLSYLGLSGGTARDVIGYTAEEFIRAWKKAMDYIIQLNRDGNIFVERGALIFLQKMLRTADPGYLDLRSPCGAGVGQLAYNYNGKVYVCDEARTLEDDTFLLGDVTTGDYRKIAESPKIKTMLLSSTLENFACDECVYKPYCGICPVLNYLQHGTIFPQIRCTDNCKINSAMLDYLFEKMRDRDIAAVFRMWTRVS